MKIPQAHRQNVATKSNEKNLSNQIIFYDVQV